MKKNELTNGWRARAVGRFGWCQLVGYFRVTRDSRSGCHWSFGKLLAESAAQAWRARK